MKVIVLDGDTHLRGVDSYFGSRLGISDRLGFWRSSTMEASEKLSQIAPHYLDGQAGEGSEAIFQEP